MKNAKLREMTLNQLENHTDKLRNDLATKSRQLKVNELPNVREVRTLRNELARTLTMIYEFKLKEPKNV